MENQFLQSFLVNMDSMTSFAIFGKVEGCVLCEGKLSYNEILCNQLVCTMERSICSKIPIFKLTGVDGNIFQCIKTGQTGFIGQDAKGEILVAQKSESVSIIFIGKSNYNGSFLYNITRALRQHESLNNGNIDQMNIAINNNSVRLKG